MPVPEANRSFADLLTSFTEAIVANDGAGLGALFAEDGVYADEFFGAHRGRAAIAAMLQRFHDTGSDYRWDFFDPVSDGERSATQGSVSATARVCPRARGGRSCSKGSASFGWPRTG